MCCSLECVLQIDIRCHLVLIFVELVIKVPCRLRSGLVVSKLPMELQIMQCFVICIFYSALTIWTIGNASYRCILDTGLPVFGTCCTQYCVPLDVIGCQQSLALHRIVLHHLFQERRLLFNPEVLILESLFQSLYRDFFQVYECVLHMIQV